MNPPRKPTPLKQRALSLLLALVGAGLFVINRKQDPSRVSVVGAIGIALMIAALIVRFKRSKSA